MDGQRILREAVRTATGGNAAVYALAAIGLNIHFGYTGLLNFGHVGFMLVGAYGLAITVSTLGAPLWAGVLVGLAASLVLALLLGGPTLRLRADYLAIVTIAGAEILRHVTRSGPATDVTGGVFGLTGYARGFDRINPLPGGRYGFWVVDYSARQLWPVLVGWGLVLLASLLVFMLTRSPWGRVLRGIREDEDAVRSIGKNAYSYKMQSLVLGGMLGGIAGMIWVVQLGSIDPDAFLPMVTFFTYTIVILGGPATVVGPVVGAVVFWFVVQGFDTAIREASTSGYVPAFLGGPEAVGALRFLLVGAGLMLLMIYRPEGMFGNRREMQLDVG
ncbi:MAG TPA: branched-chain amino acid ABC transporter permease [Actinomycetota bacterium]|nr:branched-chain amino acid ABC transporter permease [Actinomycetota bacterium]